MAFMGMGFLAKYSFDASCIGLDYEKSTRQADQCTCRYSDRTYFFSCTHTVDRWPCANRPSGYAHGHLTDAYDWTSVTSPLHQ